MEEPTTTTTEKVPRRLELVFEQCPNEGASLIGIRYEFELSGTSPDDGWICDLGSRRRPRPIYGIVDNCLSDGDENLRGDIEHLRNETGAWR